MQKKSRHFVSMEEGTGVIIMKILESPNIKLNDDTVEDLKRNEWRIFHSLFTSISFISRIGRETSALP